MGAIHASVNEFTGGLSEMVGYKSGLGLTRQELHQHLEGCPSYDGFILKTDGWMRMRSEEYQNITSHLLWRVGYIDQPTDGTILAGLYHRCKHEPQLLDIYVDLSREFVEFLQQQVRGSDDVGLNCLSSVASGEVAVVADMIAAKRRSRESLVDQGCGDVVQATGPRANEHPLPGRDLAIRGDGPDVLIPSTSDRGRRKIDPTNFVLAARKNYGLVGMGLALEMFRELDRAQRADPWDYVRTLRDWKDTLQLRELFESESLTCSHGSFIDQRFVDYLAANLPSLDRINWRKFEGMAAEYFERQGYTVQIGPGRNDNGVDIRLWNNVAGTMEEMGPPLILVQCKRERKCISKVVVKALWADIVDEKAESGLVVTTSRLSPGADRVISARGYPIESVDRPALAKWLQSMRSPGLGAFLAE